MTNHCFGFVCTQAMQDRDSDMAPFSHYLISPARLISALALVLGLTAPITPAQAQIFLSDYDSKHPLKIMAIGDSITDDCSYNGAWRQYLQPMLQSNGYAFTFVGRQLSSPIANFTGRRHEGYCGAVIAAPGLLSYSV